MPPTDPPEPQPVGGGGGVPADAAGARAARGEDARLAGRPAEGVDGEVMAYQERLTPPWWLWLVVAGLVGMLAVAYGAALNATVGWGIFGGLGLLVAVALWRSSPVVRVDDRVFRAGRARLPLQFVGAVLPLDAASARDLRGPGADVRAHLCLRTWLPRAVRVDVDDPTDPHPYWLVSTRRPDAVAAALRTALGRRQVPRAHGGAPGDTDG